MNAIDKNKKNWIKEIRESRGLTVRDVADLCGVSKSHISNIEKEAEMPTQAVMVMISLGLGIPINEVFNLDITLLELL